MSVFFFLFIDSTIVNCDPGIYPVTFFNSQSTIQMFLPKSTKNNFPEFFDKNAHRKLLKHPLSDLKSSKPEINRKFDFWLDKLI